MIPTESVAGMVSAPAPAVGVPAPGGGIPASVAGIHALPPPLDPALITELWRASNASSWGLTSIDCAQILFDAATASNFGLPENQSATPPLQAAYFRALCLPDLVLARACARGHERAWQHFVAVYRQPLIRAAIAITGSESLGRDLADQLYAELYGLTARDGERRCPLASYRGRGSLMAWLRTTLAQRHVDHHRRTHREQPLDSLDPFDAPALDPPPTPQPAELSLLARAIASALQQQDSEVRFLLAAYYLDGQTMSAIARTLRVHEATVSRTLQRTAVNIRKQVLRNLQQAGLSRRAAEESLGVDPRDLDLNLKKLLQTSQSHTFSEQAES
jgi:RNA polymerase sigma-70 factor (ECF subfamily)